MAEHHTEIEDNILFVIEKDLEQLLPPSNSASIHRVPKEFRQSNEKHFTPTIISIGPLHAKEENLCPAHLLKLSYLKFFLTELQPGKTLKDLIQIIRGEEEKARLCYDVNIYIDTDDFVRMMVLDGCFILGLILEHPNMSIKTNDSQLGSAARHEPLSGPLLYDILKDLLLLENQLPFFVLTSLYKLVKRHENDHQTLVQKTLSLFQLIMPIDDVLFSRENGFEIKHLLHLVLLEFCPRRDHTKNETVELDMPRNIEPSWSSMKRASVLQLHGIKFKGNIGAVLTDAHFSGGVLELPRLVFQELTIPLFWNLLALDQCLDEKNHFFTSYAIFMDNLIDDENDIELLIDNGVIDPCLNDKQALVTLFNNLAVGVVAEIDLFQNLSTQVNRYCDFAWRPYRAYLVDNYYDVRWQVLNSILLFILTLTQTLFTVLAYHPKNE
ncbi:hypothetical protein F0562_010995 [Nyssa sinensis]|uniref:Uncharacterized protein n=1 Tax=Nyssa sinensis TaxID=561372 RepID=A0A5J5A429_9ASTE|nr:hypothetical protein F0562_010995 [Nyssa sinensis]